MRAGVEFNVPGRSSCGEEDEERQSLAWPLKDEVDFFWFTEWEAPQLRHRGSPQVTRLAGRELFLLDSSSSYQEKGMAQDLTQTCCRYLCLA